MLRFGNPSWSLTGSIYKGSTGLDSVLSRPNSRSSLLPIAMKSAPSPGNVYSPNLPPTHIPSLEFIYRLECGMSPDEQVVGRPSTSQNSRIILPITGGTVLGPEISGIIVPSSGADWATSLPNESVRKSRGHGNSLRNGS